MDTKLKKVIDPKTKKVMDIRNGKVIVPANNKSGWRVISNLELKNKILAKEAPDSILRRLPLPPKTGKSCLLAEELFPGCTYCNLIKAVKEFTIQDLGCLEFFPGCRHRQKKELLQTTLCTLCENEGCVYKKPSLSKNQPVEVSQDGKTWKRMHVSYVGKGGSLYCYEKGGTSATVNKVEKYRYLRTPGLVNSYNTSDKTLDFVKVAEWGSRLAPDTLVTASPNFMSTLFYATGNFSENGVEVLANGATSYSGKGGTRLILEFPVWKLI